MLLFTLFFKIVVQDTNFRHLSYKKKKCKAGFLLLENKEIPPTPFLCFYATAHKLHQIHILRCHLFEKTEISGLHRIISAQKEAALDFGIRDSPMLFFQSPFIVAFKYLNIL